MSHTCAEGYATYVSNVCRQQMHKRVTADLHEWRQKPVTCNPKHAASIVQVFIKAFRLIYKSMFVSSKYIFIYLKTDLVKRRKISTMYKMHKISAFSRNYAYVCDLGFTSSLCVQYQLRNKMLSSTVMKNYIQSQCQIPTLFLMNIVSRENWKMWA